MVLGTVIRYGLPFSFVYCTIYQTDIWREGDERLFEEQKQSWRKFFNGVDRGYHLAMEKLHLTSKEQSLSQAKAGWVAKYESMDMVNCWNSKVRGTFKSIDLVVSNPSVIACKVYRSLQPYISNSSQTSSSTVKSEQPQTT